MHNVVLGSGWHSCRVRSRARVGKLTRGPRLVAALVRVPRSVREYRLSRCWLWLWALTATSFPRKGKMEFVDLLVYNCCGRHALAVFKKATRDPEAPGGRHRVEAA